mmetsp:Transcript_10474/g.34755  ORF Transcript_10474/g.34755 Transcript_10474/m.34755 type:complete len:149 (-) Transcript_10474:530-976(-)|eukprot:scaffold6454_cov113-Isochrysis_galbana.AAC.3
MPRGHRAARLAVSGGGTIDPVSLWVAEARWVATSWGQVVCRAPCPQIHQNARPPQLLKRQVRCAAGSSSPGAAASCNESLLLCKDSHAYELEPDTLTKEDSVVIEAGVKLTLADGSRSVECGERRKRQSSSLRTGTATVSIRASTLWQ